MRLSQSNHEFNSYEALRALGTYIRILKTRIQPSYIRVCFDQGWIKVRLSIFWQSQSWHVFTSRKFSFVFCKKSKKEIFWSFFSAYFECQMALSVAKTGSNFFFSTGLANDFSLPLLSLSLSLSLYHKHSHTHFTHAYTPVHTHAPTRTHFLSFSCGQLFFGLLEVTPARVWSEEEEKNVGIWKGGASRESRKWKMRRKNVNLEYY